MLGFNKKSNLPDLQINYVIRNEFNRLKSRNPPVKLYKTLNEVHFNPKSICLREWINSAPQEWLPLFNSNKKNLGNFK